MAKIRPRNSPPKRDRAPVEAPEEMPAERSDPHRGRWTDGEKSLYFGAPEETPIARRDEAILGHARKAEARGNNVVNLLSELEFGDLAVSRFERRTGKAIEWGRFFRVPLEASQQRRESEEIEKRARAIEQPAIIIFQTPEEKLREIQRHQEWVAARREELEERRKTLEEKRVALGAEWKEMHVLRDLIRDERSALECPRVRSALEGLRASARLYANKDLPSELKTLLRLIGNAIAHPTKYRWKPSERENEILYVWNARERVDRAAFEAAAERLFKPNSKPPRKTAKGGKSDAVTKLEREARRYIAKARAKEARLRRSVVPRPARSGRAATPDEKG